MSEEFKQWLKTIKFNEYYPIGYRLGFDDGSKLAWRECEKLMQDKDAELETYRKFARELIEWDGIHKTPEYVLHIAKMLKLIDVKK